MSLRTKLYINIFSWLGFALILVASLMTLNAKIQDSLRGSLLSDQILMGASDMSTITYDYLLNPGERTRKQWEMKHASLESQLRQLTLESRNADILSRMRKNHEEAAILFRELVSNFREQRHPGKPQPFIEENRERITAGLIARSRMIVSDAARLTGRIGVEINTAQSRYLVGIFVLLGVMIAVAAAIAFLTSRAITGSIDTLRKGTESLARGDLSYVVPVKGKDEIAALSRGFNDMADKLRLSRENLESEISKKEKAREEVRKAYTEMEERVIDRTREITFINEELVRSQNRLKSTIRDLESFTYSVSHDLRAPLRAIDGFTMILMKELETKLDGESLRRLRVVRESTEKMNRLIDALLNLSRLGRQALTPSRLDMGKLFREAWTEVCQSAPDRKIRLDLGNLKEASGDEALIRQVVLNLLSNSIKYTRNRDDALVEVNSSDMGDSIVYSVRDNGTGFDMKYAGKLFGVFQRLHPESEYEGTGVGLAIVHRIITRHGGRVWAEGEVGNGATFHFSLPR